MEVEDEEPNKELSDFYDKVIKLEYSEEQISASEKKKLRRRRR